MGVTAPPYYLGCHENFPTFLPLKKSCQVFFFLVLFNLYCSGMIYIVFFSSGILLRTGSKKTLCYTNPIMMNTTLFLTTGFIM